MYTGFMTEILNGPILLKTICAPASFLFHVRLRGGHPVISTFYFLSAITRDASIIQEITGPTGFFRKLMGE
jgi:hypothetical protein